MRLSRTCIAAIVSRRGKIIMAGDRRCSWDWGFAQSCPTPKIIKHNGFLLGGTGSSDFLELILEGFTFDQDITDLKQYLLFSFKSKLTKFLTQHGYRDQHSMLQLPQSVSAEILLGKDGKLFIISFTPGNTESGLNEPSIISIGQVSAPFAVGCGAPSAIPILINKLKEVGYSTKEHLELAMQSAADISPGCDNQFDFLTE